MEFDVTVGVPDAVHVLKEHLAIIKPTSRRNLQKRERLKAIIKAELEGGTQADIARELSLDPGFLSRQLKDAYKDYPKLGPALRLLNLLNLQAKRDELSSSWLGAVLWGLENSRQDKDPSWPSPYADKPNTVKLIELHRRAFPQPGSNFSTMVDDMAKDAVDVGTQRVLRTAKGWDKGYDEADRTDYQAALWQDDYRYDSLDVWLRLRRSIDCPATFKEFIVAFGGYPLEEHLAWFFHKEDLRRATVDSLPSTRVRWKSLDVTFINGKRTVQLKRRPACTPWSLSWRSPFVDAPSSNHGYLGPIGREIPRWPTPAPIRTNYYTKGFKLKKKLLPLSRLRGKGPRSKLFATAVLNHGKPNINSELRRQFPEPASCRLSAHDWKKLERRMHESKWAPGPMCQPVRQCKLSTAERATRYQTVGDQRVQRQALQLAKHSDPVNTCRPYGFICP
jgi:hypothetical protein